MLLTIILIYWLSLSAFYFQTGQVNYLQAFFPFDFQELILRFIGIFFILAGNFYLLFRKRRNYNSKETAKEKINQKEQNFRNTNLEDSSIAEIQEEGLREDISVKDRYLIHRAINAITKLAFNNISGETFIKLVLNFIVSEKYFIDCQAAIAFLIGDQADTLKLTASHNISSLHVEDCRNVNFKKCICGKAAEDRTIQFSDHNKGCPISSDKDSNQAHSHYCIPLLYQGDLVGVLDLFVFSATKRTKNSDEYLMSLANNVAVGIKHKRDIEQVVDINKCLSGLSGDPEENIKRLVKLYGEISAASSVFYKKNDKKNNILKSFFQYNPPQYYDDQEGEDSIGRDILKSEQSFVIIPNLTDSKYVKKNLNIIRNDFLTCIGSTIKSKNEPVGVIFAFYKRHYTPSRRDQNNLKVIASAICTEEERIYSNHILREAYSKLKKAQGSLVQSEKLAALGRFASGIAHEVKNPLGVVLGGIEFLEKKIKNPEKDIKLALTKVKDSILRANSIVRNLLTFAQPSAKQNEVIDLKQLVEETLSLLKYKVSLVNIKIINEIREMPIGIVGDKNQIQQVLFNLFLNAIEAMPKGGKLIIKGSKASNIKLAKVKNCYVIEIIDTGEGIPEENLSEIFEPFFTTKRDSKGTGLGLAMCKMIVENNEGKLLIKSNINKGTTAKVILPVVGQT